MRKVLQFIHDAMIMRRIILLWALWLTTIMSLGVWQWVETLDVVNTASAAMAGAILTPVLTLTGWIVRQYATNPYVDKLEEVKDV